MMMMAQVWQILSEWLTADRTVSLTRGGVVFVSGLLLAAFASMTAGRALKNRLTPQHVMIVKRALRYGITILAVISALRHVGFDLSVLVGAAGILTIALGFASQTSASNMISGLFLMGEQPFVVGDVIRVGATTGEVISVDLLSVKLRTFDNLQVRIPNESLLKSEITNVTHFPIRRLDMKIGVAYKEDITQVREVLEAVADANPLSLDEPRPLFIFNGFADSALDIQFSVWSSQANFLLLRNSIYEEVKVAFDAAGIEIPFPHTSLYTGSVTEPFPIRLVSGPEPAPPPDDPA